MPTQTDTSTSTGPSTGSAAWPVPPWWVRHAGALQVAVVVVALLAIAVDLVLVVQAGGTVGGAAAVLLPLSGLVLVPAHPHVSLVVFAAAPLASTLLGWEPLPVWSVVCFAAFLLTARGLPGVLTACVLAGANLVAVGHSSGTFLPSVDPAASIAAGSAVMTAAVGAASRAQQQYWTELAGRARDAVTTRQVAVDRGVARERVQIARDLHDSIGHEIAVVSMHLGAAQVHLPPHAGAARSDLEAARDGIQAVLHETQHVLRVLRTSGTDDMLAATPEHGRVFDLVESFRAAGLDIEASLPGLDLPLAPDVSAAVFRIAQESLTNAQRHGAGGVSLRIEPSAEGVSIEVVNRRRPAASSRAGGGGSGIVGMRERVASVGGHLEVRAEERLHWLRVVLPTRAGA